MSIWQRLIRHKEPAVASAAPVATAPAPPASPRPATTAEAMEVALRRLLTERCGGVLATVDAEILRSDAPALLSTIQAANDLVVRPVPSAAQRALRITRNPEAGVHELVQAVEQDLTLTQALLTQSNSAWYRRAGVSVTTINDAVNRIGMSGVHAVVMKQAVHAMLCRPGGAYEGLVQQVWSHLQRTGPLARRLARPFGVDPDSAFLLGLLHDVGKLIVLECIADMRRRLHRDVKLPPAFLPVALDQIHEPLGGLAASRWGLPPGHARAVARHHRRPIPEGREPLTEVLWLAERLDLARIRGVAPDLGAWWKEGQLRAELAAVAPIALAEPPE